MSFILVKRDGSEVMVTNSALRNRLLTHSDLDSFESLSDVETSSLEDWQTRFLKKVEYEYPTLTVEQVGSFLSSMFKARENMTDKIFALEKTHFLTLVYLYIEGLIDEKDIEEVLYQDYYHRTEALLDYLAREDYELDIFRGLQYVIGGFRELKYNKTYEYQAPKKHITAKNMTMDYKEMLFNTWLLASNNLYMLPIRNNPHKKPSFAIRIILSLIPSGAKLSFGVYGLVLRFFDKEVGKVDSENYLMWMVNNQYLDFVYNEVIKNDIYLDNLSDLIKDKYDKKISLRYTKNIKSADQVSIAATTYAIRGLPSHDNEDGLVPRIDVSRNIFQYIHDIFYEVEYDPSWELEDIVTKNNNFDGSDFDSFRTYISDILTTILPVKSGKYNRTDNNYLLHHLTNIAKVDAYSLLNVHLTTANQKKDINKKYKEYLKIISNPGLKVDSSGELLSLDIDKQFYIDFVDVIKNMMNEDPPTIENITYSKLTNFTNEEQFVAFLNDNMRDPILAKFEDTVSGQDNKLITMTMKLIISDYFEYLVSENEQFSLTQNTKNFFKELYKIFKVFKYIKEVFSSYNYYMNSILAGAQYSQIVGVTTMYPYIDTYKKALIMSAVGSIVPLVDVVFGILKVPLSYSLLKQLPRWKYNGRKILDEQ